MLTMLKVTGLVYVCEDPELRYTPNQKAVVSFLVAANRSWTNESGNKVEDSCFISCQAWGNLAEAVNKSVVKGDPLYIEGNLKQDSWEKDGVKHTKHTVTCDTVVFLKAKTKE